MESSGRAAEAKMSASTPDTVPKTLESALDSKKSENVATSLALAVFPYS